MKICKVFLSIALFLIILSFISCTEKFIVTGIVDGNTLIVNGHDTIGILNVKKSIYNVKYLKNNVINKNVHLYDSMRNQVIDLIQHQSLFIVIKSTGVEINSSQSLKQSKSHLEEDVKMKFKLRNSVLRIKWKERVTQGKENLIVHKGVCFFVKRSGIILTADHVLNKGSAINHIFAWNGMDYYLRPKLITRDSSIDFAVLSVANSLQFDYIDFISKPIPISLGDKTFTVSYDTCDSMVVKEAEIVMITPRYIYITNLLKKGMSGSPFFDDKGKLIGLACAKDNDYLILDPTPGNSTATLVSKLVNLNTPHMKFVLSPL